MNKVYKPNIAWMNLYLSLWKGDDDGMKDLDA
jgi:hypothetical protein